MKILLENSKRENFINGFWSNYIEEIEKGIALVLRGYNKHGWKILFEDSKREILSMDFDQIIYK